MFSRRTNWQLAPNRFSAALQRHRAAGREVLDLTVSNPTSVGLRYDAEAILSSLADAKTLEYRPEPKGMRSARDAVAAYYAAAGGHVDAERVLLTTSTSEGYSFIFRLLCEAGDEVLAPAPSYPLFEFLAELQDVQLKTYPLFYDHGWHIDVHALANAISERTRAVMLVHPNNPTGSYVKPDEMAQLNALCSERGTALVADEVFLDFAHDEMKRTTFSRNSGALTFTLSGLSKIAGLPQMKFAWMAVSGPENLAGEAMARLEVIADTYLSMNAPIQMAAPVLFAQRESFQRQLMARIRSNLAELDRQLGAYPGCTRLQMEGGWYSIVRVPATQSDEELAIALLERRSVLVHPGHFYNFPSDGHLVVSLIARESEFKEGVGMVLEGTSR